jgi:hypothetical protein
MAAYILFAQRSADIDVALLGIQCCGFSREFIDSINVK